MNAHQKEYFFVEPTNLLCVWHIEKNVMVKTKWVFQTNDSFRVFIKQWKRIMYSVDEHSNTEEMERLELNGKIDAVDYIKKGCMHFGNAATTKVEGMHSSLKSWLRVSSVDLKAVFCTIRLAVEF